VIAALLSAIDFSAVVPPITPKLALPEPVVT